MSLIAQWTKNWAKKNNQNFIFYTKTTSSNDMAKKYATTSKDNLYTNSNNSSLPINEQTSLYKNRNKNKNRNIVASQPQSGSCLFIAEFQTKGRGRKNRQWINSDMMLSWSYSLEKAPQPITVHLMGQALLLALKKSWAECPFTIKKPNDIYIKNKKLAGLLIEAVNKGPQHTLIIGAGMNVFTHPPLSDSFTHLQEHIQKKSITEKHWFSFLSEWNVQILKNITSEHKNNF